jgi:hypothetical protein
MTSLSKVLICWDVPLYSLVDDADCMLLGHTGKLHRVKISEDPLLSYYSNLK